MNISKEELNRLSKVHQRIVKLSNTFYDERKSVRDNSNYITDILLVAEEIFPNHVIMVHNNESKRVFFTENVKAIMGYHAQGLINMTDDDFLCGIHPEDVKPVRLCMQHICKVYETPGYDHVNTRYRLNMRYLNGRGTYTHLSYEAITIQCKGEYADVAVINDITADQPFHCVELCITRPVNGQTIEERFNPMMMEIQLTQREQEIAVLTSRGLSNSEMAGRLGISEFTVKNHKKNLFRKFNVRSGLQLIPVLKKTSMAL
ncbi:hypothetical protein WSM22_40890 [Cytophagales bacterium WSM2-2]|nr:hypothetical protein WSM22_40890 [Cytophagales bacterium WSM2-2]